MIQIAHTFACITEASKDKAGSKTVMAQLRFHSYGNTR